MTISDAHGRESAESNVASGQVLAPGARSGLFAGIIYIAFQMAASGLLKGEPVGPLRQIAAMLLGREALAAWYPALAPFLIGFGIHLMLSILFGVVFAWILARFPYLGASPYRTISTGAGFGLGLWSINYYLIAPLFAWYWFPLGPSPWLQDFIGHTVFFGMAVGCYFHRQ